MFDFSSNRCGGLRPLAYWFAGRRVTGLQIGGVLVSVICEKASYWWIASSPMGALAGCSFAHWRVTNLPIGRLMVWSNAGLLIFRLACYW